MHEMSLAGGILKIVDDAAAREPFARVERLALSVGRLSGVDVESLRFALGAMAPGTRLEGAAIVIDQPAGQARCLDCGASVTVAARTEPCPRCGAFGVQPTGGTEFKVVDLVVAD